MTRTQPGADALAEALAAAQHTAYVQPVLEIQRLEPLAPRITGRELCIVLSVHAVDCVLPGFQSYLAIGAATQRALQLRGIAAQTPELASSEGVVHWLQDRRPESVLLVTGEGGRGVIEAWLRSEGIPVEVCCAYRRVPAAVQVKTVQIDAIEAASGDGVRRAAQVWFAAGGESQVPVLVPTARVGAIAAECGFREIVICAGASPVDVLRGLRQATMDRQ